MDRLAGSVLVLFALFVAWEAWRLPLGTAARPGPGYFPLLLAGALAAVGLLIVRRGGAAPRVPTLRPAAWRHPAVILGACAFSAFALERLGYRLTAIAVLGFLLLAERRTIIVTLVLALLAAFGTYALFNDVLLVPLPRGPLGF